MAQSLQKNIRVTAEQWARIEEAASEGNLSPNQLVIELAIEAQALARDLIANGREHEVQEIREFISTIVPDVSTEPSDSHRTVDGANDPKGPDSRP